MNCGLTFLDLFAGAGGLSEGFIQAGFDPVAHVESDPAACFTLKTRMAYHWLMSQNLTEVYVDYLERSLDRNTLYSQVPEMVTGSVINEEINEESLTAIFQRIDSLLGNRKLDLIIGGPPCQAYSLIGRSRDVNRMKGDKRNYLYTYYAEFLRKYDPLYFIFENVIGLHSANDVNGESYLDTMRDMFFSYGYETELKTLTAYEHGVPQRRKRIVLVGRKGKQTGFYPDPESLKAGIVIDEVFSDLPALKAGQGTAGPCHMAKYDGTWLCEAGIRNGDLPVTWHQARPHNDQDLEIYKIAVKLWNRIGARLDYNDLPDHLKTHRNRRSFKDRFKVVASDLPYAQTIVAHIARDGHYYIHPDIVQNRSLTPREAARLQTFPDDYFFESRSGHPQRTHTFSQIGNAVPVLLARKIADKLKETWK